MTHEPLLDPDCRAGTHDSCTGGPCECDCHTRDTQPDDRHHGTQLTPDPLARPHGPNGRFLASPETARRDSEAADLRAQGLSLREVGERLGITRSAAQLAVERALVAARQPGGETLRALEEHKLDLAEKAAWEAINAVVYQVSNGVVVRIDGELQRDYSVNLAGIDRLVKIAQRRSKLLGLDPPTTTMQLTLDMIPDDLLQRWLVEAESQVESEREMQRMIEGRVEGGDE